MSNYLDYIFYRISKVYYRYDGDYGFTAAFFLTLTEGVFFLDILMIFGKIIFSTQTLRDSIGIRIIIVAISFVPLIILNFFRYIKSKKKYPSLNVKWENESNLNKIVGTILVVCTLIAPWILLVIVNTLLN